MIYIRLTEKNVPLLKWTTFETPIWRNQLSIRINYQWDRVCNFFWLIPIYFYPFLQKALKLKKKHPWWLCRRQEIIVIFTAFKNDSPGPAYSFDPLLGPRGKENRPSFSFGVRPKTPGKFSFRSGSEFTIVEDNTYTCFSPRRH